MNRRPSLITGLLLAAVVSGCSADNNGGIPAQESAVDRPLDPTWQLIELKVKVASGHYRFDVNGRCAQQGQSIYAEGTSRNAEFSFFVEKNARTGLAVFFSNRDDEWEILLEPSADTSAINEKNIFIYSGDVPRNHDESILDPLEIRVLCMSV